MFFIYQVEWLPAKLSGLAWIMLGIWGISNQQLALYAAIAASVTTVALNIFKFYKEIRKKK